MNTLTITDFTLCTALLIIMSNAASASIRFTSDQYGNTDNQVTAFDYYAPNPISWIDPLGLCKEDVPKGTAQETAKIGGLIATHGQTMSNKQLDKLTKNIRAEGIKEPLTVTEQQGKLYILDGHHRALAAPRAGITEVPINRVELPFGAYKTPADLTFTPGGY